MDVLTIEQRKKNMQAIKSRNTKIEELLAKALRAHGIRYRRENKEIFGNPDFAFRRLKIAVFCDSEYFHGKDWDINKHRIKTNTEFWHRKIESNMNRDSLVNETLLKNDWKVIRFWGEDVQKNMDFCIETIKKAIEKKRTEIHQVKK
jgi:DNA mismatch endonuclease (patch repair protein)